MGNLVLSFSVQCSNDRVCAKKFKKETWIYHTILIISEPPYRYMYYTEQVPPTGHYGAEGRWHSDLLWAVGEHPYGPLSNSSAYSQILLDAVLRNAILAGIAGALRATHASIALLDEFANDYAFDPHGEHLETVSGLEWLQESLGGGGTVSGAGAGRTIETLPRTTMQLIEDDLAVLERKFVELSDALFNLDFGSALDHLGTVEANALELYRLRAIALLT